MAAVLRPRGVMKIKRKSTPSVVGRANLMCTGIDDNPGLFSAPNPPTAAIKAQVVVVNAAETAAAARAKGAAATRDVERNTLVGLMETEAAYLQSAADKSATYDRAVATLQAGGLLVALVGQHYKPLLGVKQGPTSGTVVLDANKAALTAGLKGNLFFNWQSTLDGKTFTILPSTPNHKTSVANLPVLTSVGFRVAVTDAAGNLGEWSQLVYFLVH
jgi:hypothetical protein